MAEGGNDGNRDRMLSWAGRALFTVVLVAVLVFFWWFL